MMNAGGMTRVVNVDESVAAGTSVETKTMTGGQALVASLQRQGIDTVFGLPGVQLDGAFDALYDAQQRGDIRVVHTRHEQATAYMADGYARVTGRLGTCLVGPGRGLLHEIPNQIEMVRSVTKYAARAMQPDEIPALVDGAVRELWRGRVRPVEVEIPPDVLFAEAEGTLLPGAP